jgi:hypothetical protein
VFIVEITTSAGKVCESYATYEEPKRCVDHFPAESVVGLRLILQVLADSTQRLVRDDGKPLQWHRLPDDRPAGTDEPVPLSDVPPELEGAKPEPIVWPELEDTDAEGDAP